MEINMEYTTFAKKLYEKYNISNNDDQGVKIYADLLGRIFCDVKEYQDSFNGAINVKNEFAGEYKTLGEYFLKSDKNGIDIVTPTCVITNIHYVFHFYDDCFTMKDIAFNGHECSSLMKPKFQKRYIAEMFKMFGEPYKKQYQKIITEKQKALKEEANFLK